MGNIGGKQVPTFIVRAICQTHRVRLPLYNNLRPWPSSIHCSICSYSTENAFGVPEHQKLFRALFVSIHSNVGHLAGAHNPSLSTTKDYDIEPMVQLICELA